MAAERNPPSVSRIVAAVITMIVVVTAVWAVIEWRMQPPPANTQLSAGR